MRRVPAVLSAVLALFLVARPVHGLAVHVDCPDCSDFPIWLLVVLTVVGVVLGNLVFYVPYRLSRRIADPRRRVALLVAGFVGLLVMVVVVGRVLVLLLPDS